MQEYSSKKFYCQSQEEIHEMQQYLTGELFIYIDNILTMESENFKTQETLDVLQKVVREFLKLFIDWLEVAPAYDAWEGPMLKHPDLYLVSAEAAILQLGETLFESVDLIFNGNKRSANF